MKKLTYSTQYGNKKFPNPDNCDAFCTRFEKCLDADGDRNWHDGDSCWDCASADVIGYCENFYQYDEDKGWKTIPFTVKEKDEMLGRLGYHWQTNVCKWGVTDMYVNPHKNTVLYCGPFSRYLVVTWEEMMRLLYYNWKPGTKENMEYFEEFVKSHVENKRRKKNDQKRI